MPLLQAPAAMALYVPLHNHSHFSLLDGMASPGQMAAAAKALGFTALALTDHGTCAGLYEFAKACKTVRVCPQGHGVFDPKETTCAKCKGTVAGQPGLKAILGMEAYFVEDRRVGKPGENRWHLTLWAKNREGYRNLMQITSASYRSGFYGRPRVDFELLQTFAAGLMAGSACAQGILCGPWLKNQPDLARRHVEQFRDLFREDFYIEVMSHRYFPSKADMMEKFRQASRHAYELAHEMGIKPIYTGDAHYCQQADAEAHDVLLSIATRDTIKNQRRFSFQSRDFYLHPSQDVETRWEKFPDLLRNTHEVAAKVETDLIQPGRDLLPPFPLPAGFATEDDYLRQLVDLGMQRRKLAGQAGYEQRKEEELETIRQTGFARYFLILDDLVRFTTREKIRLGPGRGSGVASLCLYCLRVTSLDPIRYRLMFSRFLSADRISPPDVDIDFDRTHQDRVFDYIRDKYGQECIARISTYGSLKAKDAVKRVAKALDIGRDYEAMSGQFRGSWKSGERTMEIVNRIAKMIPDGPNVTIDSALAESEDLRALARRHEKVFALARRIEGTLSTAGVHPAGILICREPIVRHAPLRVAQLGGKPVVCTQYSMTETEDLGLLKIDILALNTISVIDECLLLIGQEDPSFQISINEIEPSDPKVFDMLNRGHTVGVFQFGGDGITQLLTQIGVDSFEDMIVTNALFRPGPLRAGIHNFYCDYKHRRRPVEYLHPVLEKTLGTTYGMMIFQESIVQVAMHLAGYSASRADNLRKACGKKVSAMMAAERSGFVSGCLANGVSREIAEKVFEQIDYFAGYGFNRSHSAGYSYLAYQTAYLKCHRPRQYFCALLSCEDNEDNRDRFEREAAQTHGIPILAPHVNRSGLRYRLEAGGIRKPLTALKGIGSRAAQDIVGRQAFESMDDFVHKTLGTAVNSAVLRVLAEAGCMESWGLRTEEIMERFLVTREKARKWAQRRKRYGQAEGSLLDAV